MNSLGYDGSILYSMTIVKNADGTFNMINNIDTPSEKLIGDELAQRLGISLLDLGLKENVVYRGVTTNYVNSVPVTQWFESNNPFGKPVVVVSGDYWVEDKDYDDFGKSIPGTIYIANNNTPYAYTSFDLVKAGDLKNDKSLNISEVDFWTYPDDYKLIAATRDFAASYKVTETQYIDALMPNSNTAASKSTNIVTLSSVDYKANSNFIAFMFRSPLRV